MFIFSVLKKYWISPALTIIGYNVILPEKRNKSTGQYKTFIQVFLSQNATQNPYWKETVKQSQQMAMIKTPTHKAKIGKRSFHQNMPTVNIKFCILLFVLIQHICTGTSLFRPTIQFPRAQSNKKQTTWGIFFFFILSALNIHTNQCEKRDKHSKIKKNWAAKFLVLHEWCTSGFHRYCCFLFSIFFFTHSKVLHVYNFLALYKYLQTSLSCVP